MPERLAASMSSVPGAAWIARPSIVRLTNSGIQNSHALHNCLVGRAILPWGPLWGRLSAGSGRLKGGCGQNCPPHDFMQRYWAVSLQGHVKRHFLLVAHDHYREGPLV